MKYSEEMMERKKEGRIGEDGEDEVGKRRRDQNRTRRKRRKMGRKRWSKKRR